MPKRWCAQCEVLFDMDSTGTRKCPGCQQQATTARNARPSSSRRGLGWKFTERKKADAAYQQAATCQCTGCPLHSGGCGQMFTRDNPKTAGHAVARIQGGGDGPILAVCRACNSSDGGRLGHRDRA